MTTFRLGDRVRIIKVDIPYGSEETLAEKTKLFLGAEGVVIRKDPRWGYDAYFQVWPDDESLCNPGPEYKAWCIEDGDPNVELVSRASIEELLTSERDDWRELGRLLSKKRKRFSFFKRLVRCS